MELRLREVGDAEFLLPPSGQWELHNPGAGVTPCGSLGGTGRKKLGIGSCALPCQVNVGFGFPEASVPAAGHPATGGWCPAHGLCHGFGFQAQIPA
ncbi:hypothetical protein Nmel_010803 [Mimus melanotis]